MHITQDKIVINFHIRKNSKLGLNRHVGHVFANYGALCPVKLIVEAMLYLDIEFNTYLFHSKFDKDYPILPSSLVSSIKATQRLAGIRNPLTLTDFRSSTITTLAKAGLGVKIIEVWGGWRSDQTFAYVKANNNLQKDIQKMLD